MDKESQSVVQIDENHLDRECIRLPSDYLKAAVAAAEAKRDLDEARARLDVVEADLAKKMRQSPESYGLEKVTEASLKEAVLIHRDRADANQEHQAAKYAADIAQAVVWALEHKKRSLTLLVDLHGMGYFSEARIGAKGREAVEEMTKKAVRRARRED